MIRTPTRPKRLRASERRAATVEAVLALAAKSNPSEITTSSVTEHMGMTEGALFRHFPDKAALWNSVMQWIGESLLERVDRAAQSAPSPLVGLERMFMAHVEFIIEHPGIPRLMFSELQKAEDTPAKREVRALLTRYTKHLERVIESGKTQGEIAADISTRDSSLLFVGTIQGLVTQSLLAGSTARMRADARRVFTLYRRGIRSLS